MLTLSGLKNIEVEYREMYERGTVLRSELAEVVAMRKLLESALGIGVESDDSPEKSLS
jgi:hypothetical protein